MNWYAGLDHIPDMPIMPRIPGGVGNVTRVSFKCGLSLVAGTAFVNNPSFPLAPYVGALLTLTSGGKTLTGYIKAAGTGETLDTELITGWINSGLETLISVTPPNITAYVESSDPKGTAYAFPLTVTTGALYKSSTNITLNTGVVPSLLIYDGENFTSELNLSLSAGTNTVYWTQVLGGTSGNYQIVATAACNLSAICSYKKVLTPSATGCTIVSTAGGTTYNWASNDGIDPNATSFTVTIAF
jgi:hypothetical protein